ncbi:Chlorophyllide a oxygenase [Spatholobus suberectus]|nr:Chlorophyllide a oxygenase [Spatholobus suberectus]
MPSTRLLNVKIKSIPCSEKEGLMWIWPGNDPPTATLPFEIHAELVSNDRKPLSLSSNLENPNNGIYYIHPSILSLIINQT